MLFICALILLLRWFFFFFRLYFCGFLGHSFIAFSCLHFNFVAVSFYALCSCLLESSILSLQQKENCLNFFRLLRFRLRPQFQWQIGLSLLCCFCTSVTKKDLFHKCHFLFLKRSERSFSTFWGSTFLLRYTASRRLILQQ